MQISAMTEIQLISAFSLGLAGAGHCLGMCGGIASALSLGGSGGPVTTVSYHFGRLCSYTILGGLLGFVSASIDIATWTLSLRYIAGGLLIAMGLYIGNWWLGMAVLEKAGARLWQPIQRLSSAWLPIKHPGQALALGLTWGLMPCGLIYSSLAWATAAGNGIDSALLMFVFGLGTLPAMLTTSVGANRLQQYLRLRGFKILIAMLLILSGLWTIYAALQHGSHQGHSGHELQTEHIRH